MGGTLKKHCYQPLIEDIEANIAAREVQLIRPDSSLYVNYSYTNSSYTNSELLSKFDVTSCTLIVFWQKNSKMATVCPARLYHSWHNEEFCWAKWVEWKQKMEDSIESILAVGVIDYTNFDKIQDFFFNLNVPFFLSLPLEILAIICEMKVKMEIDDIYSIQNDTRAGISIGRFNFSNGIIRFHITPGSMHPRERRYKGREVKVYNAFVPFQDLLQKHGFRL
jgi:hypothetical protein